MKKKNILLSPFEALVHLFKNPSLLIRSKKLWVFYIFVSIPILLLAGGFLFVVKDIPKATVIGNNTFAQSSKIYDRNGTLLYTIYADKNQSFVPLNKIPKNLQEATIAIEDRNFYKHGAIDIRGIARAALVNAQGGQLQGGSTLTQQLVKSSLLTLDQTITRKLKEILLAYIVEGIYSKDKILEMYLNQVSYGGTSWGVEAASQAYFDKPVTELTLAESAYIAGLPQAPSAYSPFGSNPERGKARQKEVLKAMVEAGYITPEEEKQAAAQPLKFEALTDTILAPHFVFYIKKLLSDKYGEKVVEQGGLNVMTSLDLGVQKIVDDAIATEGARLRDSNWYNAAAVVTNPGTGEVLAMAGSRDYFDAERDGNVNVTTAKRQPGSSIKPINYATGLVKGFTAATPFVDESKCFPNTSGPAYCPKNYDNQFHGVQQMRNSLANSYNIPAVKMLQMNGLDAMIATASAMGITTFTDPDRYGLSLTLGGGEVTMMEMAQAYGVFANSGYKVNLHPVLKVTNSKGEVLEEYKPPKTSLLGEKVIPEGVAFIISNILSDNNARAAAFGTNSLLNIKGFPVAVKTGTTNDYRDNWTIGYTPSFVTAVWVGNNDNTPLRGVTSGVSGAAPIWNGIMTKLLQGTNPEPFQIPDSVVSKTVCSTSGLLPEPAGSPYVCPTRSEYFIQGTEPKVREQGMEKVFIDTTTNGLAKEGQTENVEQRDAVIVTDKTGDRYCVTCPRPEASPTPTP